VGYRRSPTNAATLPTDLQVLFPQLLLRGTTISPWAKRSGGTCVLPIAKRLLGAITTLPFAISTGAKRSGEISVWMLLLLGDVFDRVSIFRGKT
jgi:hypothetical protein